MSVASYFDGMDKAKAQGGGQYIKGEGSFLVTIGRLFVNEGHKGKFFVAEFSVDESTSPQDPAGSTRSWVCPLQGERAQYSFGDIKNLIFALTGHDPKDVGSPSENPELHGEATKLVMAACDQAYAKKHGLDPTMLLGEKVFLETNAKPTKKGGTFTTHRWSPVTEE